MFDKIKNFFDNLESNIQNVPILNKLLEIDKLQHFTIGVIVTSIILVLITLFFGIKLGVIAGLLTGLIIGLVKETYDEKMDPPEGDHFNIEDLVSWMVSSVVVVTTVVLVLLVM